jgi:predicted small integral membrane protein
MIPTGGDLMFTDNPFSGLASLVSPAAMQVFVVAMILLVAGGTLYDVQHKGSARYFFANRLAARKKRTRQVSAGEAASLAVQTAIEGLTSGEFCNVRRRLAHLLTMYGFLAYVIATIILVFVYPTPDTPAPAIITLLWHIGALMICVGGYWFWFFIRVDVVAEGKSPFQVVRADLFILSLLANATLALVWSWLQSAGSAWSDLFLGLYLFAALVLFGSVPWSKFSHMFFKPAAAFQRHVEDADGSRANLPPPADGPALLGSARQQPRNY